MTLPRGQLLEAAERWGTPLYVTDLDAAAAAAHAWRAALPGALVAYAVKANPDPALLRRLADEGFGFEVVGPIELALALRAGGAPERIVVNGVGQTDADLGGALGAGALVNAESLGALEALLRAPGRGRIGLRINPALDAGAHPHLATGSADAKFGIALDELLAALGRLGRPPESVGAHIGSAIADADPYGELAAMLARLANEMGARQIDLGGGFAGEPEALASALRPHLPNTARLIVEPTEALSFVMSQKMLRGIKDRAERTAQMQELTTSSLEGVR